MPRPLRRFVPGIPVHVIQRGNNRQRCFYKEDDYRIYLRKLGQYSRQHGVAIHSFVLMTNHVHLLATPCDIDGISLCMQTLGRYYVRYINNTYSRSGTLWEGRFKASLIDTSQYFLTVSRYIEMNPVRARLGNTPADYPWSSYHTNANGASSSLLVPHGEYLGLGNTETSRREAYRKLFDAALSQDLLQNIRTATNKAWVLGDADFKRAMELRLGVALPPVQRGGDRRSVPKVPKGSE